jgi:hypothetical protein
MVLRLQASGNAVQIHFCRIGDDEKGKNLD